MKLTNTKELLKSSKVELPIDRDTVHACEIQRRDCLIGKFPSILRHLGLNIKFISTAQVMENKDCQSI
jgi:hypothetical protein